jgi:hypothetical protein
VGSYGLEVNFGNQSMSPIAPPNTVVAQQPNAGGGSTTNANVVGGEHVGVLPGSPGLAWSTIGSYSGWAETYSASAGGVAPAAVDPPAATVPTTPSPAIVGPVAAPSSTSPPNLSPITPLSAPAPTPAAAPAPHKLAHQAVDATLSRWTGRRGRPRASTRVRSALHEHDLLS